MVDVNYDVGPEARDLELSCSAGAGIIPYRVELDNGLNAAHVFVHRDDHRLLRDLALQPAGPRQSEDGTRDLQRLVKRRRNESEWELIDHATCRVRIQAAGGSDEESSEDEAELTSLS